MTIDPIRIFIGASSSEWLPAKVLEYSIRVNTRLNIEANLLSTVSRPFDLPVDKKNWPRTPFSFQRFLIPEICDHKGRAIYLDADMLVFSDISAVWTSDFGGADVLTTQSNTTRRQSQFSVMLLDCEKLDWSIESIIESLDKGLITYEQLMYKFVIAKNPKAHLPWSWNSLEYFDSSSVNLLHYTDMNIQPWISIKNKYCGIWISFLRRAIDDGFVQIDDVVQQVNAGFVRPSILLELLKNGDMKPSFVEKIKYYIHDFSFKAPYKSLQNRLATKIKNRYF